MSVSASHNTSPHTLHFLTRGILRCFALTALLVALGDAVAAAECASPSSHQSLLKFRVHQRQLQVQAIGGYLYAVRSLRRTPAPAGNCSPGLVNKAVLVLNDAVRLRDGNALPHLRWATSRRNFDFEEVESYGLTADHESSRCCPLLVAERQILRTSLQDTAAIGMNCGRHVGDVLYRDLIEMPESRTELRVSSYHKPRSPAEHKSIRRYFIGLLCSLASFFNRLSSKADLPEGGKSIERKDNGAANRRNARPIIQRIAYRLRCCYKYVAAHPIPFFLILTGVAVDVVGIRIAFFCDNCSGVIRVGAGLVGILGPQLLIAAPLLWLVTREP